MIFKTTIYLSIAMATAIFGAPQGQPNNWTVTCNPHLDGATANSLFLELFSDLALIACISQPPLTASVSVASNYNCANVDIPAVNGQTYDICGPINSCVTASQLIQAAAALQNQCLTSNGTIGGTVAIGNEVTVQL
jgi:hypothetical protein